MVAGFISVGYDSIFKMIGPTNECLTLVPPF